MSGFIDVKSLCALLSLVCLYYYSFRQQSTLWNKKSYKNPCDSHFHSFLFSLILFGNWPKASLPGILLCPQSAQPFSITAGQDGKLKLTFPRPPSTQASGCGLEAANQTRSWQNGVWNEPGGRGGEKEEGGVHFALQIRLKFHLPSPPQSWFPSHPNLEGTSVISLLCILPSPFPSFFPIYLYTYIYSIFVLTLHFFNVIKYAYHNIYHRNYF